MKVGITYDLQEDYLKFGYTEEETAELDKLETIIAIEENLKKMGFQTFRIGNINKLVNELNNGSRWDFVFNICEGMNGIGREAQVPALLDAFKIPYTFSDPLVLSLTLHKGMAKRVIRDLGIPTANFIIYENEIDINSINIDYPLFIKPVGEGTGKGISEKSKVNNYYEFESCYKEIFFKYNQPVLVEKYLSGREFTVGIVGTGKRSKVIGVLEIILKENAESSGYSYLNKENYENMVEYRLLEDCELKEQCKKVALDSWRGLGCRDGGRVDLRCDENGIPNFIEVNPLAGLHPVNSDLPILTYKSGLDYQYLIKEIINSTLERIKN